MARERLLATWRFGQRGRVDKNRPGLRAVLGVPGPHIHVLDGRQQPHAARRSRRLVSHVRRPPRQLLRAIDRCQRRSHAQRNIEYLPLRTGQGQDARGREHRECNRGTVPRSTEIRSSAGSPGTRKPGARCLRAVCAWTLPQYQGECAHRGPVQRADAVARLGDGVQVQRSRFPFSAQRANGASHGPSPDFLD